VEDEMRRSIYNDYRPLRIVLLLLLVVLGLVAYFTCGKASSEHVHTGKDYVVTKEATCTNEGLKHKVCTECDVPFDHTVIPMLAHNPSQSINDVKVAPTCTEGGTHDVVVNCKDCGYEISRVEVADKALGHKPGTATKENNVNPTHTKAGSYNSVTRCVTCKETLSVVENVVDPIGHNYTSWNVEYDEENGIFVANGKCSCNEEGNKIAITDGTALNATRNEKYAPCCKNEYIVKLYYTYEYNGKTVLVNKSFTVDIPKESHKLFAEDVYDIHGNLTIGYVDLELFASYDNRGIYYDLDTPEIKKYFLVNEDSWDETGYGIGYFKCQACIDFNCQHCCDGVGLDAWFAVRIYSKEKNQLLDQ
jgi:hypothetical protein